MRENRPARKCCRCAALDLTSCALFASAGTLFLCSFAFALLSRMFPYFC